MTAVAPTGSNCKTSIQPGTRSIPAHLDARPAVPTMCCCCCCTSPSSSSSSSSSTTSFLPSPPCLLLHRVPAAPAPQEAMERQDGQGAEDVHHIGPQLHGGGGSRGGGAAVTSRPLKNLSRRSPDLLQGTAG